ncbi:Transposase IS4 [Popillia japonica]|uniref:Transposase IS4 n=1 Tax=Popillia japonica TaxID=7064 RepID=A0AAW1HFM5_POPJA
MVQSGIRAPAVIDVHQNTEKVWNLLFDDTRISLTVQWTNAKLNTVRQKYKRADKRELNAVDDIEMKEFMGLLIYTAFFKCNTEDIASIFSTDGTGRDIFILVMSQKRFAVLLSCLRFNNPEDRTLLRQLGSCSTNL